LQGAWPDEAFGNDIAELGGVRARVISLRALKADKAEVREDSIVASKDRADLVTPVPPQLKIARGRLSTGEAHAG
jgi:hypothetical protein